MTQARKQRYPESYRQLLLEVSTFFHPSPEVLYRFIADRLSEFYGGATAAITLHQGARIVFKHVANPPEWAKGICEIPTEDAYCARTLRSNRVTLIQNVQADTEFCHFPTVRLGWTRYLGAPVRDNRGNPIGTLCIIDNAHEDALTEEDCELMALLAMRVSVELERERLFEERLAQERRTLEERNQQLQRTQQALDTIVRALRHSNVIEEETLLARALAQLLTQVREVGGAAIIRTLGGEDALCGVLALSQGIRETPLRGRAWRNLWQQVLDAPEVIHPLPAALARQIGGAWGIACAYRNALECAGVIALACSPIPEADSFRAVYLEPMLNLVAQIMESYHLRKRLQEMYEELTSMQAQLVQREKLSVVGALAATTAHDIRNIVSSLTLSVSLNRDTPERLIDELKHQLDRMSVLAHRLLSYARPRQLMFEPVHLPSLLQQVAGLIDSQARLSRVAVKLELSPRLPRIEADPNQLEHLLVNLALNGIKAMELSGGGALTLRARRAKQFVCLSVGDTGPGIPEPILSRLFEPFTTTREDGFGLGLFSVKRAVEMHHGRIEVHSQRQQGTRFEIYLPLRQPETGGGSDAKITRRR